MNGMHPRSGQIRPQTRDLTDNFPPPNHVGHAADGSLGFVSGRNFRFKRLDDLRRRVVRLVGGTQHC